jgi:hypothetical protein
MCYKSPWGRGREKRCPSTLAGGPWRRPLDIKLAATILSRGTTKGAVGPQLKIVACGSSVQHSTILVQFMLAAIEAPESGDGGGRHHFAGRIDYTADGALRSNRRPLRGARIDALQMVAV